MGGREAKSPVQRQFQWHFFVKCYLLDGCESDWTPGVGDGQGGLACCDLWGRKESDMTERLIWSDLIRMYGGFSCGSAGRETTCNAGDLDSIPGFDPWVGKILWRRKWQLQYSCLENPSDRETWQAIVHGAARIRHDLATKPPAGVSWPSKSLIIWI